MKIQHIIFFLLMTTTLFSCSTIPKGAKAVEGFDKAKYLGKWYEIARFDFSFERNLSNTTAQYSLNKNGTIKVDNQGYNEKKNEWTQAIGKGKFVDSEDVAMLKVSFFGPFYGGYNVIALDEDYQYALIAGSSLKYLWLLSREKTMPEDVKQDYLKQATAIGYDVSKLLWIAHDRQK